MTSSIDLGIPNGWPHEWVVPPWEKIRSHSFSFEEFRLVPHPKFRPDDESGVEVLVNLPGCHDGTAVLFIRDPGELQVIVVVLALPAVLFHFQVSHQELSMRVHFEIAVRFQVYLANAASDPPAFPVDGDEFDSRAVGIRQAVDIVSELVQLAVAHTRVLEDQARVDDVGPSRAEACQTVHLHWHVVLELWYHVQSVSFLPSNKSHVLEVPQFGHARQVVVDNVARRDPAIPL